jgi:phosphoribosyl-AMP cyclohydrolase / phosphoribosyl-ATP pyrophosphohydrolase
MTDSINFEKMGGLVPAVVQDADDRRVLMVGFMDREALRRTLEELEVVFWSRSRKMYWKKGETSGNILALVSVSADCDADSLLVLARPSGPVCHTGSQTCFPDAEGQGAVIETLARVIIQRRKEMPQGSYTAELFRSGIARIGQKVGEEAVELAIAAQYHDRQRCVEESADLLYHLLVLLAEKEIPLTDVYDELGKRMPGGGQ